MRHHLIDVLDVTETSTVADFQRRARNAITDCSTSRRGAHRRRGFSTVCPSHRGRLRVPGYRPGSSSGLESELERIGSRSLHRKLASVDPAAAATIEPGNGRRIVRALEVGILTGHPQPPFRRTVSAARGRSNRVGHRPGGIDRRVAARVHLMWQAGLVDEVRQLEQVGLRRGRTASRALGYRQVLDFWPIPSTRLRRRSRRSSRPGGSPADRTHGSGKIREFTGCAGTTHSSSIRPMPLPEPTGIMLRSQLCRPDWGTVTPWKTERHAALVVRQGAWHGQRLRGAAGSRSHDAGRLSPKCDSCATGIEESAGMVCSGQCWPGTSRTGTATPAMVHGLPECRRLSGGDVRQWTAGLRSVPAAARFGYRTCRPGGHSSRSWRRPCFQTARSGWRWDRLT